MKQCLWKIPGLQEPVKLRYPESYSEVLSIPGIAHLRCSVNHYFAITLEISFLKLAHMHCISIAKNFFGAKLNFGVSCA